MTPGDIPHRSPSAASIFIITVLLWLIPVSIWAYLTRPAAVRSASSVNSLSGPATTVSDRTGIAGGKASK